MDAITTNQTKPEWVRPGDVRRIFGISRSQVYKLLDAGELKAISLKKRGQRWGSRLISYDSLSEYVNKHAKAELECATK